MVTGVEQAGVDVIEVNMLHLGTVCYVLATEHGASAALGGRQGLEGSTFVQSCSNGYPTRACLGVLTGAAADAAAEQRAVAAVPAVGAAVVLRQRRPAGGRPGPAAARARLHRAPGGGQF